MTDFDVDYLTPEKKKSKWAVGCAIGGVLLLCLIVFIAIGGYAWLLGKAGENDEALTIEVVVPTEPVSAGEIFSVEIILSNTGDWNIAVKNIYLPNTLLESALLVNAAPVGNLGESDGSQTKFGYDVVIAPNGSETFVYRFQAINPGTVKGQMKVGTEVGTYPKTLRMTIAAAESEVVASPITTMPTAIGEIIPYRSVVQITALINFDGEVIDGWWGSGTLISEDGLILTNAHVVLSDRFYDVVDLIVSITVKDDEPPKPMFYADVLQADWNLDLAVIKIRSDLHGNRPDIGALGIEPVKLGRADTLKLGDPIVIIGYPGIGGATITLTRGEVSGFTAEEPYGNRAFIKTSGTIAGGNSGGLAATPNGEIIGVPTQVGSGELFGDVVDCRPLADTNRDGIIDERDNCVPTGGFINALRPINLAQPLIDAAMAGQVAIVEDSAYEHHYQDYEDDSDVVLFDAFVDNRNGWNLGDLSTGWADIVGGQLVINVEAESYYIYTTLPGNHSTVVLMVDFNVLQATGVGDLGFVCGYVNDENYNVLEISEDGYYSIWSIVDGEYVSTVDWTYSSNISTYGTNTLFAYCGYDGFFLAINDTLLVDVDSNLYRSGEVGLLAGTYAQPNIMVGFSDFAIFKP